MMEDFQPIEKACFKQRSLARAQAASQQRLLSVVEGCQPSALSSQLLLRLQDRHLIIEDFQPSKEAGLKERCPEVRSLMGVFDGHKRSEPAETAARRLPELLAG